MNANKFAVSMSSLVRINPCWPDEDVVGCFSKRLLHWRELSLCKPAKPISTQICFEFLNCCIWLNLTRAIWEEALNWNRPGLSEPLARVRTASCTLMQFMQMANGVATCLKTILLRKKSQSGDVFPLLCRVVAERHSAEPYWALT